MCPGQNLLWWSGVWVVQMQKHWPMAGNAKLSLLANHLPFSDEQSLSVACCVPHWVLEARIEMNVAALRQLFILFRY